ncbi:MAG: peptidoglycan DD-metalloendopeptidase family protein [Crocinitomicaceae bacterium]
MSKFIWILLLFVAPFGLTQQKESDRLRKKQEELQKKIDFTEKLLESTKADQNNLTQNLSLIERKIEYRKDLLNNIQIQLSQLDADITDLTKEIELKELEIEHQKEQYRKMIQQAYKMRDANASLVFILSSESFNQANKRMEYMNQLKKYREDQILKIQKSIEDLKLKLSELEAKKAEKETLASSKVSEQKKYVNDREKQKSTIQNLQGKEQQLKQELAQQKKKSQEIQAAINAAINKEILAERKKKNEKPPTVAETKEVQLSNKGFEANKGKLPWPVKKGEITKGFGKQPHPVHVNVFTYNNGVDITTVQQSTVRAVYDGEVTSVIVIPGAGKAVIVKHGTYRTIYSNLQETYVKAGDKISAKQEIGALLVNSSGNSEVHFEIRQITSDGQINNINPTYWLYR